MYKTLYFNIEDDIKTITGRIQTETLSEFVLVFPRRSYIFSDPLNLKMLKKQLDILKKQARIMTMDERGQQAATSAGFTLEQVPVRRPRSAASDMAVVGRPAAAVAGAGESVPEQQPVAPVAPVTPPATKPVVAKVTPPTKPIPQVQVRDTIFSEVPRKSGVETELIRGRAESKRKTVLAVLGAAIVLALVGVFALVFVLPSADVTVVPTSESVVRDMELTLAVQTQTADVATLALPAMFSDVAAPVEKKIDTLGKKEVGTAAAGTVRIFNLTGAPINLRAGTTKLSASGRTFVFRKDQNYIKAVTKAGLTNPNAGQVAEVVAEVAGDAGNLAVGTKLEISNQVFGNKPDQLYAVVEEAFVGGSSRFVSVVEEQDITKAQENLMNTAVDALAAELKTQGRLLAESAYSAEISDFSTDKPAGTEATSFVAKGTVRVRGLSFEPVGLTDLVRRRVTQVLPQTGKLQAVDKDTMNFRVKRLDLAGGEMSLMVHLETRMFKTLDTKMVTDKIQGKKVADAEKSLIETQDIEKVSFSLWPSWFKNVPRLASRISVTLSEE